MSKWTTYRIKDVAKLISEKTNDFSLPYIALDNIVSWDASFIPSDSSSDGNSNECEAGDVLFGKLRPYLAKGYIPFEKSICSPEFLVLRPSENTHNRFLLYYLLSNSFISHIRNQVAGVKMPRTNWAQISVYQIFMPPLEEQEEIAGYLDKECGKIDRKVELLERKADAYSRLRRSLINREVTSSSWKKKRIKDIFNIIGGNGFKVELQGKISGDYPFVKTSDINSKDVYLISAANYVDKSEVDSYKFNIVPKYSIICSKIGAALKLNHRKLTTQETIIDNNLQALVPFKAYNPKFFFYLLTLV